MARDITVNNQQLALRGGNDGASRLSRELSMNSAPIRSADAEMLPDKRRIDANARDATRHDGYAMGTVATHRDSIVGAQFILNAQPKYKVLGMDETWAEEFQEEVETKFQLYAESQDAWIDASRHSTLTGLVRLVVGTYVFNGEFLGTAEWLRDAGRPYATAVQLIDPDRLSNPQGQSDTESLRGGIERNRYGAPQAAHIRVGYENDPFNFNSYQWKRVPWRKPWGRLQVLHGFEPFRIDQTRGVAEMVSVLKQMRMTSKFQDIVLQNAVLNATYAATIESELPRDIATEMVGAENSNSLSEWATNFLGSVNEYQAGSKHLQIDGLKIPHLFPGTKLHMQPAGTAGGIGTGFEESLLRHIAAGLGVSYEQLSRDYSKTNYSSARASMLETWKYMQSRKKMVADRFASMLYTLWFEEAWNRGDIVTRSAKAPDLYLGQNKDAYTACAWIGSSRGQIDEMKETQAAMLRVKGGLSTFEDEHAKLGKDYREVFRQISRERKMLVSLGLDKVLDLSATKPGANDAQNTMNDNSGKGKKNNEDDDDE